MHDQVTPIPSKLQGMPWNEGKLCFWHKADIPLAQPVKRRGKVVESAAFE